MSIAPPLNSLYNKNVGIYSIKPRFQQILSPLTNLCVKLSIPPDYLNFFALALSLIAFVLLANFGKQPLILVLVSLLMLIRLVVNALDGLVARAMKLDSKKGLVKNEFVDRVSDVLLFIGFSFVPAVNVSLLLITIVSFLLVSYLGILSLAVTGVREYTGIMGKADRIVYLTVFSLIIFFSGNFWVNYYLSLVFLGSIASIYQRLKAIYARL